MKKSDRNELVKVLAEEFFSRAVTAISILEEMTRCFDRTMRAGAVSDEMVDENDAIIEKAEAFLDAQMPSRLESDFATNPDKGPAT